MNTETTITASSLEEVAQLFEKQARARHKEAEHSQTPILRAGRTGESVGLNQAARMLRQVTLVEMPKGDNTLPPIVCPKCGNTDPTKFRYIEDIECWRQVDEIDGNNSVISVGGLYTTGEGYDDGTCPRLECQHNGCYEQFPIPPDVQLEFT